MKTPNFLIVGAPKSGTTALYYYLKQHPEVFMSERKEPHFFGRDLVSPGYMRDKAEYLELFSNTGDAKGIGEASVWYLYSQYAAREIHNFNPHAKIIIMLRNPIDLMYSYHSQRLYNGTEDLIDFREALEAEVDRKNGYRLPRNPHPIHGLQYKEIAKLSSQTTRYLDTFGADKVHIIVFDEFKCNTQLVYRSVLTFLGLSPDFQAQFKVINSNKSVRSNLIRALLKQPPIIFRLFARKTMPSWLRYAIVATTQSLNTRYERRPTMDEDLRKTLMREFTSEIDTLGKILQMDLSRWTKLLP